MAFDVQRDEVVLFGGVDSSSSAGLDDTWTWDGASWSQAVPAIRPPAARSFMTYDSVRDVTLLANAVGELWQWDGANWQQRASWAVPSVTSLVGLSYDSARDRSVLVASVSGGLDVFEWDGSAWARAAAGGLLNRRGGKVAFDSVTATTLLVGGVAAPANTLITGVQAWDGVGWAPAPGPSLPESPRELEVVYQPSAGVTVAFGGDAPGSTLGTTMTWDGSAWQPLSLPTAPASRLGHGMALDINGDAVLFGGTTGSSAFADTWAWDGQGWTQQAPSQQPSARSRHAMAFDSARGETMLFGGLGLNDTWVWNGAGWQQRSAANPPPVLATPSMAYDAKRDRMVLAGSGVGIWEWDGSDWEQVSTTDFLFRPELSFDARRGQLIVWTPAAVSVWDGESLLEVFDLPQNSPNLLSVAGASITYDAGRDEFVVWGYVVNGGQFPGAFIWNQTLLFRLADYAIFSTFGMGCAAVGAQPPTLTAATPPMSFISSAPVIGTTMLIDVGGMPTSSTSAPVGVLGFDRVSTGGVALPLALDIRHAGMQPARRSRVEYHAEQHRRFWAVVHRDP